MSDPGEYTRRGNTVPLPEYIQEASPIIREIVEKVILAAREKGTVSAEYSTYRPLTSAEEGLHRIVDPVIQKTFDIPWVGEHAEGVGVQVSSEAKKGRPSFRISYGLDVRGFNHSDTHNRIFHQGITIYTLNPDGSIRYWKNQESREEQEDAPIDEDSGLKVVSPGSFMIGQMMDSKTGLDHLNDEEKQRLYQLASEYGIIAEGEHSLIQAVQELIQAKGASKYELLAVKSDATDFFERRFGSYQVLVERAATGDVILTYQVKAADRFKVRLAPGGQILMAESYPEQDSSVLKELEFERHEQENEELAEKGFTVFNPIKTLKEASRIYHKAREEERQVGLLTPSAEELNEYLDKINKVVAIYQ